MQKAMAEKGSEVEAVANDLVAFLNVSPTPFHAVKEATIRLKAAGYVHLSEREAWSLKAGGKYFFTRNFSTIIAFGIGKKYQPGNGFMIIGAHTDSPCLKLKPVSRLTKGGFLEVGVQTYGGGLWHTWFDRDISVAGRVIVKHESSDQSDSYSHELVRIQEPIMRIPTLAIHLDRNADGFKPNTQTHLVPLLATAIKAEVNKSVDPEDPPLGEVNGQLSLETEAVGIQKETLKKKGTKGGQGGEDAHHPLLLQLIANELGCELSQISDFELQLYDTQPSVIGGACKEFIFSGRLDNLCMSFCALKALIDMTDGDTLEEEIGVRMVTLFDHEEIGSNSAQGAGSPIMLDALSRVTRSFTNDVSQSLVETAVQQSYLVSADMAHCLHPNYQEKHDDNHQPKMHKGLVIKHNANQRYATNAITAFIFRQIGEKHKIPTQDFVVRNDMACGSTIGPILASGVGIRTVDVGAPQLSMHSIREMCGVDDVAFSYQHFKYFFQDFMELDSKLAVNV